MTGTSRIRAARGRGRWDLEMGSPQISGKFRLVLEIGRPPPLDGGISQRIIMYPFRRCIVMIVNGYNGENRGEYEKTDDPSGQALAKQAFDRRNTYPKRSTARARSYR